MTIYKKGVLISCVLVVISMCGALILNYAFQEQFWCNVLLGVYGSSLLTLITSLIGYFADRKAVMEQFYTNTLKLLNKFNRYQNDFSLEQKINFYLDLADYDITDWDMSFGKMDFFFNGNRAYIYAKIYKPLLETYHKSCSHSWHFRMHTNGTGVNEVVMQHFVDEIEPSILEKKALIHNAGKDDEVSGTSIKNKIEENILTELDGKYYALMYGKKKYQKNKEHTNG